MFKDKMSLRRINVKKDEIKIRKTKQNKNSSLQDWIYTTMLLASEP